MEFYGLVKWTLLKAGHEIVSYQDGKYLYRQKHFDHDLGGLYRFLGCTDKDMSAIRYIAECAWEQKHGTMLVIFRETEDAIDEVERLVGLSRGIRLESPQNFALSCLPTAKKEVELLPFALRIYIRCADLVLLPQKNIMQDVTEDPRCHDTWRLLKKYRDVVWSLELSVQQLKNQFQIEYGSSIEDFLESVYLAGADLGGTQRAASASHSGHQLSYILPEAERGGGCVELCTVGLHGAGQLADPPAVFSRQSDGWRKEMKIGLIDVDNRHYPNLAFLRAAYTFQDLDCWRVRALFKLSII